MKITNALSLPEKNHALLLFAAFTLSVIFFTVSAFSANNLSNFVNINDYNLVCPYSDSSDEVKVLVNTYSLNVGVLNSPASDKITDYETLLIQPIDSCQHCYNITIATPQTHNHIYLMKLRAQNDRPSSPPSITTVTPKSYSLSVDEVLNDSQTMPYIPYVSCFKNVAIKKSHGCAKAPCP